jgi:Protein of unknown function (DUF3102)
VAKTDRFSRAKKENTMSDLFAACDLTEVAIQINAAHLECEQALKAGVAHARKVGTLLLGAKQRAGHGNRLPWLKENVSFSDRPAQGYMRALPCRRGPFGRTSRRGTCI